MFVDWMMAVLRFAAVASVCPRIVPRDEWGARVPKGVLEMRNPVSTVVIHHTYSPSYCADNDNCVKAMQSMQKFHQDDRGWDDIGYSFVVGGDGRVYKGRGWNRVGAHSPPYNADSIGISLIGDWREEAPPKAMLDAVEWLIRCGVDTGRIAPDYQLIGHRQARDTECPGDALYAVIQTWQRYTANPAPPKVRVSSSRHHPQTDADTPDVKFTVVEPLGALSPTVAAVGTYDPKTPFYAERDAVEVRQLPKPWDRLWHIWYQAELKRQREAERAQHIEALKDEAAQQQEEEALRIEEAQQHAVEALKIEAAQQQDEEALKGEVAKQHVVEALKVEAAQQQEEEALRVEEAQQQDEEALKDEVVQQQDEEALKIEAAQQQVEEDVKKLLQQARGAQLALEILIAQQAERAQKEEAVVLAGQDVQRSS